MTPKPRTRAYDPKRDRDALWACKAAFERELGSGDASKAAAYEGKLTDAYCDRYLAWVDRCVADDPRCVTVAPADEAGLDGYAFVLPERLAMIWDGAVLNELYVGPDRRGEGVADALMGAALEFAREQTLPMDRMLLDVAPENERARGFYDRLGFEPWGEMLAREL